MQPKINIGVYMANSFKVECLNVLKEARPKTQINFDQQL